jgi:DNA-binding NarL/FixJ family response regulator
LIQGFRLRNEVLAAAAKAIRWALSELGESEPRIGETQKVVDGLAVRHPRFLHSRQQEASMTLENRPIRVLTVDDHPILRQGLAAVIATQPDIVMVGEAEDGRSAIELFRVHRPDVTLMDLRLPDMSGIDVIATIRSEFPHARIIVLTTYKQDVQIVSAIRAGAMGFLLKTMLRLDLLETIRSVHAGHRRIPTEIAAALADNAVQDNLSSREVEVLQSVAAGNSNKIVASNLGITEDTVKGHMRNILSKLGANDRTHAVVIAANRGFIQT